MNGPRSLRVSIVIALAFAIGCTNKPGTGGTGGGTGTTQSALQMSSYPVKNSVTNSPWNYHAALSEPGEAEWALVEGPAGAQISASGLMTWVPTAEQKGAQNFLITATKNGTVVEQRFTVDVTHFEVEANTTADPSNPNGSSLTVDAPLSPVRGSGVVIAPGALSGDQPVELTISEVQNPPMPLTAQLSGVTEADMRPVDFGPSGLTFTKPVTIYLPLSDAMKARSTLEVQTYDFTTGQWERVPLLSIDRENGVAAAEVTHFSLYTVTPSTPVFAFTFSSGAPACDGTAFVQCTNQIPFASIPAGEVNGYAGTATTLADVIAGLAAGESIQFYTQLTGASGSSASESAWTLASATRTASGAFTITVVSSDHPNTSSLAIPADVALADVEAWLNGSRFHLALRSFSNLSNGLSVRASASLYFLGAGGDARRPPATAGNVLGQEESGAAMVLNPSAGLDSDCDGAPDAFDATPQGDPPPSLQVSPEGPVQLVVGDALNLSATSDGALTWTTSDPALSVVPTTDGASITASAVGNYRVMVEAVKGSGTRTYAWDVFADQRVAANSPPTVSISASPSLTVREGEVVTLLAVGRDAEQSPSRLSYRWSATSGLTGTTGESVRFQSATAGDYRIACIANDGLADSAEVSLVISVLPLAVNRPPAPPRVTPLSALLQHEAGAMVDLRIVAAATDPDQDTLTYQFELGAGHPEGASFTSSGDSANFTAFNDGAYVVYVRATDSKGLSGPVTPVRIQVSLTLPPAPVDADQDGFPSGSDCNDADRSIFPGAREVCGDGVDQDCSGADVGASACDRDGDRYSPTQGDCDDMNPAKNPGLPERCDGIDNNCDGNIDEVFGVAADCKVGVGACQSAGRTVCNASFSAVTCNAVPSRPTPETCNMADDDCNGSVDDIQMQSGPGDINNCGGCGVMCRSNPNMTPQCVNGGCTATCAPDFFDVDRNLANGCECKRNTATNGREVCNGIDDDCNGFVDENTVEPFYTGPSGTAGVGECMGGLRVCVNGQMVVRDPERLPRAEQCDGRDNNCDTRIDETFPLQQDPANCGACGRACAPGQGCFNGQCMMPVVDGGPANCGPDRQLCNGLCVDTRLNPENCGACGNVCSAGNFCEGGQCKQGDASGSPCPAPAQLCQGANATYCAKIGSDSLNCGACGFQCSSGQVCRAGQCVAPTASSSCPPDSLSCTGPSGAYCAWSFIDPTNCGACGQKCPAGNACVSGQCRPDPRFSGTMPCGPFNQCGPMCTDVKMDPANCGACGTVCGANDTCFNGTCQPRPDGGVGCPNGMMCSDSTGSQFCTDPKFDSRNCGRCGNVCAATDVCVNGGCQPRSDGGTATCGPNGMFCGTAAGGYCTDPSNDPMNCGRCGMQCPVGDGCFGGSCQPNTLPDGGMNCGGKTVCVEPASGRSYCTDPAFDPMNCGGCGRACSAAEGCFNGTCQPKPDGGGTGTCPVNSLSCSTTGGGTYCTDPSRDPMNCGGCGRACGPGDGCFAGVCQPTVLPDGGANCGGGMSCTTASGGAFCIDPKNDAMNCGGCGHACSSTEMCSNGACQPRPDGGMGMCGPGSISCGSVTGGLFCTDPMRDAMNCGRCGNMCAVGTGCFAGSCQPLTLPDGGMNCGGATTCSGATGGTYCADLNFDAMNCGACGQACTGGDVCMNGSCQPKPDGGPFCGSGMMCTTAAGGSFCTDPRFDPMNCGYCGNSCGPNMGCVNGMCQSGPAADGGANCGGGISCPGPTGSYCASPMFDPMNCGSCGHACGPNDICFNGTCQPRPDGGVVSCGPGGMTCSTATGGSYCVDPMRDIMNCGACNNACAPGFACFSGSCQPTLLPDGGNNCGGGMSCSGPGGVLYCADPMRDALNCGGCGHMCAPGDDCFNGLCEPKTDGGGPTSCGMGNISCHDFGGNQFCTDPMNDSMNCGACGQQCGVGTFCMGGSCQPTHLPDGGMNCGPNGTTCTGPNGPFCTERLRDPRNCGICGQVCGNGMVCLTGECVPDSTGASCAPGASRLCYFGPDSTRDVGVCHAGVQSCTAAGFWEICNGQQLPTPEVCADGRDDDCDGQPDQGCPIIVMPNNLMILPSTSFAFGAQGGALPYAWSLLSNQSGGTVSGLGLYTSGATPGNDVVRATDADGGFAEAVVSVVNAPSVSLVPGGGTFRDSQLNVFVRTVAGATVTATLDSVPISVPPLRPDGTGNFLVSLVSETQHQLSVSATASGMTATQTALYTLDRTAPAAPVILSPSNNSTHPGPTLVVSGTAEQDVLVEVGEQGVSVYGSQSTGGATNFSITTSPLVIGQHRIISRASDVAGNVSGPSVAVEVMITNGVPGPLAANPMVTNTPPHSAFKFLATGGTPPYAWTPVSLPSGGSIATSGAYSAGPNFGQDVIRLVDFAGAHVDVTVNVSAIAGP